MVGKTFPAFPAHAQPPGGALPLWESVGMCRGFAPHFWHLDDLFAPKNLTLSTILFRSCWVPFRSPPISACIRSFCPQKDQIYHFIQILLGPILNFERCTPTDFDPPPNLIYSMDTSTKSMHIDAYRRTITGSSFVCRMAYCLLGAKPLLEPIVNLLVQNKLGVKIH